MKSLHHFKKEYNILGKFNKNWVDSINSLQWQNMTPPSMENTVNMCSGKTMATNAYSHFVVFKYCNEFTVFSKVISLDIIHV